jgi:hypothetical protein
MIYLESYTQDAVTQSSEPEAHVKSARHTILLNIYMYIINIKLLNKVNETNKVEIYEIIYKIGTDIL